MDGTDSPDASPTRQTRAALAALPQWAEHDRGLWAEHDRARGRSTAEDFSDVDTGALAGTKIVGLKADPGDFESWESDFDWDAAPDDEQLQGGAARKGAASELEPRSAGQTVTVISAAERRDLEELHKTLPNLVFDLDAWDAAHKTGRPSLPPAKLGSKDLLRDMQIITARRDKPPTIPEQASEAPDEPSGARGKLEELEHNLALAVATRRVQREVAACVDLARAYRFSNQTGAAMIQLQHGLRVLTDRAGRADAEEDDASAGAAEQARARPQARCAGARRAGRARRAPHCGVVTVVAVGIAVTVTGR